MLDCDRLVVFTLRPEQINTTSYTNTLAGAGKAYAHSPATIEWAVRADVATLFLQGVVSRSI